MRGVAFDLALLPGPTNAAGLAPMSRAAPHSPPVPPTRPCRSQVEALLDRANGEPPVMQYIARQFQELGYGSWAYRVVNSAGSWLAGCCRGMVEG